MIKILLLKIAILQLQLQLLALPPEMLILGAIETTKTYHTATTTAQSYLQVNPNYTPTFPTVNENTPDLTERVYLRNDATGKLIDENHKYFYYIDPNTKIKYTKLISTNPSENYEWR